MKNLITTIAIAAGLSVFACGETAQQVVNTVVNLSNEACTFISQDDPTAPTSVQIVCKIDGRVNPVVVNLPWNAWQAMIAGQTDAGTAMPTARSAAKAKATK